MVTWRVRGVLHYTDLFEKHGKCQSWDRDALGKLELYEGHATNNSAQQVRPIVLTLVRLRVQLHRPYVSTCRLPQLTGTSCPTYFLHIPVVVFKCLLALSPMSRMRAVRTAL